MGMVEKIITRWRRFWLNRGGWTPAGRMATRLAAIGVRHYRGRYPLARLSRKGYVAPSAEIVDVDLQLGAHVMIGERVVIASWEGMARVPAGRVRSGDPVPGRVQLGDYVHINRETNLELLEGGAISIGEGTGIQGRCLLLSALEPIVIGPNVQIAPGCSFFSYDHGIEAGEPIHAQDLCSKGPIIIEEGAWLGVGVTVLSGVTIGRGAVVGAGAVVTRDIPPGAVAVGPAAKVAKLRSDLESVRTMTG
ncbi:MAG: acyltransferase [Akkermansiaceae bacterium]|nr:acyltransferase [Akkermansiaceae bacterium]